MNSDQMFAPARLFYSYYHKDEWLRELLETLRPTDFAGLSFAKPEVYAPDMILNDPPKLVTLEPRRDSGAFKFFLKADREGKFVVRVGLYARDLHLAETVLDTLQLTRSPVADQTEQVCLSRPSTYS